jgi:GPH family glycoside/pentoside/hexuronide:cation symporter
MKDKQTDLSGPKRRVSFSQMLGYAVGEGAVSITMNGVFHFAMLYYTQVLGLSAVYAGIALSVTTFWDAVSDPVMGHITDNTRTRYGRRLPYILIGGVGLAISFLLLWIVPGQFEAPVAIFWAVLLINLLLRTAVTVYMVPYIALGFEICTDYSDRSRIQGVRYSVNMAFNFIFGAMAWTFFFGDRVAADGARIDGSKVVENYTTMGVVLSLFVLLTVFVCVVVTCRYARPNLEMPVRGNGIRAVFADILAIFKDRLALYIFAFFGLAQLAMLFIAQLQIFTYVDYMQFTPHAKTVVHGGGMIAFAIGSLSIARLVDRLDKKAVGYLGMSISIVGGLALYVTFPGGHLVDPTSLAGWVLFGGFQWLWWGGCGMVVPLATSMVADVSEIHYLRDGVLKDGSYSAVFSFFIKAASSLGLFLTGLLIEVAGYVSGASVQSDEAIGRIANLTFLSGPVIMALSMLLLFKYPINRQYLEKIRGVSQESA